MEHNSNVSLKKFIEALLFILLICTVVLVLHGQSLPKLTEDQTLSEYGGWYYLEDDEQISVELPATITVEPGESLTLYHGAISEEDAGYTLVTKGAEYGLVITADSDTVYAYEDEDFPRNDQMKRKLNCSTRLPQTSAGKMLAATYSGAEDGVYSISAIYIGTSDSVFRYYLRNDALSFGIVFGMAVLAVLSLWIDIYLRAKRMADSRNLHLALFLLLCGIWCTTDSALLQYLGNNAAIISYVSFYVFMIFPIPMIHFVRSTGDMKKYPLADAVLFAFYANVIVQSVLNYFGVFTFVQMLFVTHILLVWGVATLMVLIVREYRVSHSQEFLRIQTAFATVAVAGVFAILCYWATGFVRYEMIFEVGIIVFIILLLRNTISTMVANMHYRAEMLVYQRLSMEDKLTGMKNRRAFDDFLGRLTAPDSMYTNAALVFMDLNRLKETNDRYGHNVGDETLIAAAQCVKNAYGKAGECFRIGGDEFCAILPDTAETEEEISARLDEAIRDYNLSAQPPVSMARGISFLNTPDGKRRTLSDWKEEADLKMYKDKGWRKINTNKH